MTRTFAFLRTASAFAFGAVSSIALASGILHAQGATKRTPAPSPASAIIHACYVPSSGTIYRIKAPGTRQECASPEHVPFSWTDGVGAAGGEESPADAEGVDASVTGTTRLKVANFAMLSIPAAGAAPTVLATVTFTPPANGVAVLMGRGYCNMQSIALSDDRINIVAAQAGTTPFVQATLPEWGVMNVPTGSINGIYQNNYTTMTALPVTKGVVYTVSLYARHELGSISSDCSGSFTADVH